MSAGAAENAAWDAWNALKALNDFMDRQTKPVANKYGLTITQVRTLCAVKNMGCATVGTVAEKVGIASTNASALCKKLAQMGYLHRHRNDEDDRVVQLQLTEEGTNVAQEAENVIRKSCERSGLTGMWDKTKHMLWDFLKQHMHETKPEAKQEINTGEKEEDSKWKKAIHPLRAYRRQK